jgi:hypothetical protein
MSETAKDSKTDPPSDATGPKKFHNGWTRELENLFAEWADKASCYRWMHEKTGRMYHTSDQSLSFPVIILSTVTGAANFAMSSISNDPNIKNYVQLGLGGLSILTGIISTIANRLAYASSAEAHRVASISWGKFNRLIVIELSLHPDERMESFAFMKMFRIELDRLIEQSPSIPESIINAFIYEFKEFTDIKKPDITGDLEHTRVFSDNNSKLKRIAEDAAMTLAQKKGVLKQLVLDDLDGKVRKIIQEVALRNSMATNPFVSSSNNGSPTKGSPNKGSPTKGSPTKGSPNMGSASLNIKIPHTSPTLSVVAEATIPTNTFERMKGNTSDSYVIDMNSSGPTGPSVPYVPVLNPLPHKVESEDESNGKK